MDYQNAEFYKLNKNNPDLVYNFADELITYRKETDENGNLQIVEYRKKDGRKGKKATTRRVVPSYEMSIEDFDAWKKKLTEEAHEYFNKDKRETRDNVSIENLLETDLVCDESVEEEYLRAEEERLALPKEETVMKRTIPYGYEFRDGYIGVEKTASSVVRGIYIEYLNGKSFATIAKELTAKGIDYYQGKTEWNKQMVKRVLECPMYCGTEKYPQIIEEAQFKAVAKLIATKYGGYNNDARATVLRKRTFCQECGERIWHDMQHPKYRRWVCKKCNEHPIKDDDFYKKVTDILNAVIDHPELLDEVEPKDTYESEYEVTSKANQVNHMLTSPGVNFESAFEDILNLASLKYDNCEYDITEELTETIKQDYIGRQRLDDVDTELIERTVSHLTVNNQGKIAIHFINGATVKTEGET